MSELTLPRTPRGRQPARRPDPPCTDGPSGGTPRRWLCWAALALIGGYLLFAHLGCHGDEDNELFAILRALGTQASGLDGR